MVRALNSQRFYQLDKTIHAGIHTTLHPFIFFAVNFHSPSQSLLSRLSNPLYTCAIFATVYAASTSAFCWPTQARGPPPNGIYSQEVGLPLTESHRSGLKDSTSLPKTFSSWCRAYWFVYIVVPLGAKIGDFPFVPPPLGNIVSRRAMWFMMGNTEYVRRARELIYQYNHLALELHGKLQLTFTQNVLEKNVIS